MRHTLMSWSLHRMFLCLVFRAVNVENLASHRYVVENGINIDKTMSESSEYRAYSCSIKPKIQRHLRTFPLDFHRMKDLLVVLHLQQAKALVIGLYPFEKGYGSKKFVPAVPCFLQENNEQALHNSNSR